MERIMLKLLNEAGQKQPNVRELATKAHDALVNHQVNQTLQPWELRDLSLTAIGDAFGTKNVKLQQTALDGLQLLLRDTSLHTPSGTVDNEENDLPTQVIQSLTNMPLITNGDLQCHCLTVLLQMMCSPAFQTTCPAVKSSFQLCISTYSHAKMLSVKMAAKATAAQILECYCEALYKETTDDKNKVYDQITRLLEYCSEQLTLMTNPTAPEYQSPSLVLVVDGIETVLRVQPDEIRMNEQFVNHLWQHLCPQFIGLLGTPSGDPPAALNSAARIASAAAAALESGIGRGQHSIGGGDHAIFGMPDVAKCVYGASAELLRLLGSLPQMRSIMQALFHKMLLFPPISKRAVVVKTLATKILNKPHRVVDIIHDGVFMCDDQFALWRIILDCLVECSTSPDLDVALAAVQCADALLGSLNTLCEQDGAHVMESSLVDMINDNIKTFTHADLQPIPYNITSSEQCKLEMYNVLHQQMDEPNSEPHTPLTTKPVENYQRVPPDSPTKTALNNSRRGSRPASTADSAIQSDVESIRPEESSTKPVDTCEKMLENADDTLANVAAKFGHAIKMKDEHFHAVQSAVNERIKNRRGVNGEQTPLTDRELARADDFLSVFDAQLMTKVTASKSVLEIDRTIQAFAAGYAKDFMKHQQHSTESSQMCILNADAVYLTAYAVLDLRYRITMVEAKYSMTIQVLDQNSFVAQILSTWSNIFAPDTWLRAVYQQSIASGIKLDSKILSENTPLLGLVQAGLSSFELQDYNGRDSQIMWDVRKLQRVTKPSKLSPHCTAARKLSRRLITASWHGLVAVLSSLIEAIHESRVSLFALLAHRKLKKHNDQSGLICEGVSAALSGLQRLAHLCSMLKLQQRSGWIYRQLSEVACPLDDLRACAVASQHVGKSSGGLMKSTTAPLWPLRTVDVLSIEIMIDNAVEAASHATECWPHVIRCCEYIWELERYLVNCRQLEQKVADSGIVAAFRTKASKKKRAQKLADAMHDVEEQYAQMLQQLAPGSPIAANSMASVNQVLNSCSCAYSGSLDDTLDLPTATKVVCLLSVKVETLFENASRMLNLHSIEALLEAAVIASQTRLLYSLPNEGLLNRWTLLRRLSQIITRVAQCGRPLIHLMRCWCTTATHLVEAACARSNPIAEQAVTSLHECITALMTSQPEELDGFRFNESLLLPVQHVLCLDLCPSETQDLLVSVICELVQSHSDQIGTGWRPLFAALKAIRFEEEWPVNEKIDTNNPSSEPLLAQTQADLAQTVQPTPLERSVLDVFAAFLRTDNWPVFCLAANDCIACLTHYLHDTSVNSCLSALSTTFVNDDTETEDSTRETHLARASLALLGKVNLTLTTLYTMNRPVTTQMVNRLTLRAQHLQTVDPVLIGLHAIELPPLHTLLEPSEKVPVKKKGGYGDGQPLYPTQTYGLTGKWLDNAQESNEGVVAGELPWTSASDSQLVVVEAWLTLIEGLTTACVTCHKAIQPDVLQMQYDICDHFSKCPGNTFGAFCLRHYVLPVLQQWLRREAKASAGGWRENRSTVRNFKQAIGLATESCVNYVCIGKELGAVADALLKDMLHLLVECTASGSEFISRLGCACMRHLISSSSHALTDEQWDTVCRALWRTCSVTLHTTRLLMRHFNIGSTVFEGDNGHVQVALRKDSNPREAMRVRVLAQQVFLLDTQKMEENLEERPDLLSQSNRSVILILHPHSTTNENGHDVNVDMTDECQDVERLAFRDMVVGLVSHQLVLQLITSLLVHDRQLVLGGVTSLLMKSIAQTSMGRADTVTRLQMRHQCALFACVDASAQVAHEFDQRPALKFLVQKVFNSTVNANLYKQLVTAWSVKALALMQSVMMRFSKCQPKHIAKFVREKLDKEGSTLTKDSEYIHFYIALLASSHLCVSEHLSKIDLQCEERHVAYKKKMHVEESDPLVFLLVKPKPHPPHAKALSSKLSNGSPSKSKSPRKPTDSNLSSAPSSPLKIASSTQSSMKNSIDSTDDVFTESSAKVDEGDTWVGASPPKSIDSRHTSSTDTIDEFEDAGEDIVYDVVSPTQLDSMVSDYKRSKQLSTMPAQQDGIDVNGSKDDEEDLEAEQEIAALKDDQARCLAWTEMALVGLQAMMTQSDISNTRRFMPIFHRSVVTLTAQCNQQRIRYFTADYLERLDDIFHYLESDL